MADIFRIFIRISAFLRKEIFEILRQPRLALTLVLGPFLILAVFGIGYRNQPQELRTLFLLGEDSSLTVEQIQEYATSLGPQLIYAGVTSRELIARQKLRNDEVDLIVEVPTDAYEKIRSSQQAVFTLYHDAIDPFSRQYIEVFGQVYIDEINRRLLQTLTEQSQSEARSIEDTVGDAREDATALRQALESRDAVAARSHESRLNQNVDELALAVGASAGLLGGIQQMLGGESAGNPGSDTMTNLAEVRSDLDALQEIEQEEDLEAQEQQVEQIEEDLAQLDENLSEFQRIEPSVLVSPFRSEVESITPVQPEPFDYFAPSVIVLLLQHLAVTFAALSIVRERRIGTLELFRVSPLSAGETLIGKYISYFLFNGVLAVILSLLVVYALGVPMLGNWLNYALVLAALIVASLGIGFVISLLSETDSQAVQYSMIVLLTAVFFSGLFLSLEQLWPPVRVVSWIMPATYGVVTLRDIMLRGQAPDLILFVGLILIGIATFLIAWFLLRRVMARR
jgi:ABC-2 type transport system permease protein